MRWSEQIAWVLMGISCLLYLAILAVPVLAESTSARVGLAAGLAVAGEVTFWLGALLVGPSVMRRLRSKISPRSWFR